MELDFEQVRKKWTIEKRALLWYNERKYHNGVPLKQIQEWLGHSDFSTTANIYAHLDYKSKISSAQAMEKGMILPGADDFGSRWNEVTE